MDDHSAFVFSAEQSILEGTLILQNVGSCLRSELVICPQCTKLNLFCFVNTVLKEFSSVVAVKITVR
jgi:hypothetical protein